MHLGILLSLNQDFEGLLLYFAASIGDVGLGIEDNRQQYLILLREAPGFEAHDNGDNRMTMKVKGQQ